jgi:hypothetical protein
MMKPPPGKTLSIQQRAFLIGYKKGLNFARGEMREMARNFDRKLAEIANEYEKMIREMRRDQQRYKDIDSALKATRSDDDVWLN